MILTYIGIKDDKNAVMKSINEKFGKHSLSYVGTYYNDNTVTDRCITLLKDESDISFLKLTNNVEFLPLEVLLLDAKRSYFPAAHAFVEIFEGTIKIAGNDITNIVKNASSKKLVVI